MVVREICTDSHELNWTFYDRETVAINAKVYGTDGHNLRHLIVALMNEKIKYSTFSLGLTKLNHFCGKNNYSEDLQTIKLVSIWLIK